MSHEIKILTETDLRQFIQLDMESIDCIENAFAKLATGDVVMPPILSMTLPDANAEVDIKTAYVPGLDGFAIKVSPGFFDNPSMGLSSLNGLMVLLSATTGLVQAVFLDNGYLTDVRTAAAGAVAARYLAPENVSTIGILGTGVQARLQLIAALKVRPVKRALVWGRDSGKTVQFSKKLSADLGIEVHPMQDRQQLVSECQLVVTTTPTRDAILSADCLHPGLHITAMGSDQEDKSELDLSVLERADLLVCDRIDQSTKLGELRAAYDQNLNSILGKACELGDVITGRRPGRANENEITVCDLTGTGVQDTAIATLALGKMRKSNVGTTVTT
jgi:ectoine utilization protein EutC